MSFLPQRSWKSLRVYVHYRIVSIALNAAEQPPFLQLASIARFGTRTNLLEHTFPLQMQRNRLQTTCQGKLHYGIRLTQMLHDTLLPGVAFCFRFYPFDLESSCRRLPELISNPQFQVENAWCLHDQTDIRKVIVQRYNIALTWLDIKRVQNPVNPSEVQVIGDTISSNESFVSGWLNDQVIFKVTLEQRTSTSK